MNYLIEALCKKLEGDIAMAYANIKAYERNVVGIGEHPEIVQAIEMELEKLATAEDKLNTLKKHFS
jgi:hypothetical protein|tara:strand:+ start:1926 stop:2123 length:198 start_codon:yes stop_codon:yes gene_type:complete